MPEPSPPFFASDLDQHVLRALDVCESACLALVVAFAAVNLAVSMFSHAGQVPASSTGRQSHRLQSGLKN
jgi:hypothetical protein